MMTDIEIAQAAVPQPISEIATAAGIPAAAVEPYGSSKAKLSEQFLLEQRSLSPPSTPPPPGRARRPPPSGWDRRFRFWASGR